MKTDSADSTYILRLLDEARQEISRADNKANVLLAAATITVSVLLSGAMTGDLQIELLPGWIEWFCWFGLVAVTAGMTQLVRAVLPSRDSGHDGHADYFRDFARFGTPAEMAAALPAARAEEFARHLRQLHVISRLANRKYQQIRTGGLLLACGAGAIVVTAVIQHHLR